MCSQMSPASADPGDARLAATAIRNSEIRPRTDALAALAIRHPVCPGFIPFMLIAVPSSCLNCLV